MSITLITRDDFRILSVLSDLGGEAIVRDVASKLGVDASALMRRLAELERKGLLSLSKIIYKKYVITDEGRRYGEIGLPEERLLRLVEGRTSFTGLKRRALDIGMSENEFKIALTHLSRNNIISIRKGIVELTEGAHLASFNETRRLLRSLLRMISTEGEMMEEAIPAELRSALREATRRKLLRTRQESLIKVKLQRDPQALLSQGMLKIAEMVTSLTPELLASGKWREVIIKPFELTTEVPVVYPGRKHPYLEFLDQIRDILISMGFVEARGPHVELEFWNFDVLFQAQDHPAREIHDTFFLKYPAEGEVKDEMLVQRVKMTHENGWITGSRGWGYRWDPRRAFRLILRTQTTSVSVRTLYQVKNEVVKVFSLDRVFRPEALDATHSMEFYQCEGIVSGPDLTFRHLLGFLKEFARRLGLERVKFKPAYFPFTEPSVEGFVYHKKLGWIEALPGGMFRPEVLAPLGVTNRVLAWGIGIDRLAMVVLGIDDIRDLFSPRLDLLRSKPVKILPVFRGGGADALSRG
ncbi:MAG: phenylalanine--tRNA ligase subunit alpha [Thermoprotei archaeon]|nr:phenylalanine--tRNA ligase subunit alpha [Thermoprotei archaeon]